MLNATHHNYLNLSTRFKEVGLDVPFVMVRLGIWAVLGLLDLRWISDLQLSPDTGSDFVETAASELELAGVRVLDDGKVSTPLFPFSTTTGGMFRPVGI